jgi:hypothetical protein
MTGGGWAATAVTIPARHGPRADAVSDDDDLRDGRRDDFRGNRAAPPDDPPAPGVTAAASDASNTLQSGPLLFYIQRLTSRTAIIDAFFFSFISSIHLLKLNYLNC